MLNNKKTIIIALSLCTMYSAMILSAPEFLKKLAKGIGISDVPAPNVPWAYAKGGSGPDKHRAVAESNELKSGTGGCSKDTPAYNCRKYAGFMGLSGTATGRCIEQDGKWTCENSKLTATNIGYFNQAIDLLNEQLKAKGIPTIPRVELS